MTNKEYVIKYIQEHDDVLEEIMTDTCYLCKQVGCTDYCNKTSHLSCAQTIHEWLKQVHNINFKFGDVCEVMCLPSITELWYYVGSELCFYYFARTKEEVEQINKSGLGHYPKNNLKCFYYNDLDSFVKKVGD